MTSPSAQLSFYSTSTTWRCVKYPRVTSTQRPTHRNTPWNAAKFEVCGHNANTGTARLTRPSSASKFALCCRDNLLSILLFRTATKPGAEQDQGSSCVSSTFSGTMMNCLHLTDDTGDSPYISSTVRCMCAMIITVPHPPFGRDPGNVRDVVATYESEPSRTCPRMMQGRRRSHRSGRRASWENDSNLGRPRRSGLRSLCSAGFKSRRSRLCLRRKGSGEESDECELTATLACRS